MRRHIYPALGAATVVATLGLSACSHEESQNSSQVVPSLPATTSIAPAAPPAAPLPAPEALTNVLSRLADPAVPGADKVNLIEGATPENAAALDEYATSLRDNGYLPMTFTAENIAWSDTKPSNVMATINIATPEPNRGFTFPMEFTPFQGGWQLSRQTAEMLLALGNAPEATPSATTPAPAPEPGPAPGPPESPAPSPPG